MKKSQKAVFVFIFPALTIFILTFVYPIIRTILMSFFKIEDMTGPVSDWHFNGFGNFIRLFKTPIFLASLINLLKIFFIGGFAAILLSLILSVVLTSGIRGKKFFRLFIFSPYLISAVALGNMWKLYIFNDQYGLFKCFAKNMQWKWLDQNHIFMSMMIAYCFGMVGYHMLIFMSGIEKIGPEYFEAATLDGAGKFKQFLFVTLPLLKSTFKTNITLWSVTTASFFTWSMVFGEGVSNVSAPITLPMNYFYIKTFGGEWAVTDRNAGLGAAVGIILGLFVLVCFRLINRLIKDDDLEF